MKKFLDKKIKEIEELSYIGEIDTDSDLDEEDEV
ncbi:Uncharacterised protein [Mycoplasmopsis edwardii]|nr:Uncharacterised protein [Mycoplasmopsis edwardii]